MSTETTPATTETEPKPADVVRETIQAPHKFTDAERLTLGEQLIQALANEEQIERELDSVKQEYKSRKEKAELETSGFRMKMRDGFEMRPTVARILFNTPHIGRKTFVRDDNGEVIREEAMTFADQERPLFRNANGQDATLPEPPVSDAEAAEVLGMTNGGEDAGTTPVGEVLHQSAAATDQQTIVIRDFSATDWDSNALVKAFKKAAKAAKWSEAAIDLMKSQLKACDSVGAMKATLAPHVIGGDAVTTEATAEPSTETEVEPVTEAPAETTEEQPVETTVETAAEEPAN